VIAPVDCGRLRAMVRRATKACARCRRRKKKAPTTRSLKYKEVYIDSTCSVISISLFAEAVLLSKPSALVLTRREAEKSQGSAISHLENRVADLEIELARLRAENSNDNTEGKGAIVHKLTSQLAFVVAEPAGHKLGWRDNENESYNFGSLLSQTYLMQSPLPPFIGEKPSPAPAHASVRLRSSNIAFIPRHVIDIMLKNYCEIYLTQYPTVEEPALYESCNKIYLGVEPSHFDFFSVAMVLAISVMVFFSLCKQSELTATGQHTYTT
jgi:hypothetical protein